MCFFEWSKSVQVFLLFVYICIAVGDPVSSYQEGRIWDPIIRFNPATFLCLYQARTWISKVICHGPFFCVQWVKVRCDCSSCWYWWNCRPYKLAFHNNLFWADNFLTKNWVLWMSLHTITKKNIYNAIKFVSQLLLYYMDSGPSRGTKDIN